MTVTDRVMDAVIIKNDVFDRLHVNYIYYWVICKVFIVCCKGTPVQPLGFQGSTLLLTFKFCWFLCCALRYSITIFTFLSVSEDVYV